ncbi:MAG TPA: endonuclease MutS2 [Candidatus Stercorousia faecigallinarum]|nr:endonuclease MutS2 [Candidatus Stercorousia faecigallinarum]
MNIIEKSRKSLEFDKIAEKLSNFAKIRQSKEICLKTVPFDDIVKVKNELKCTSEAKFILDMPNDIPIEFVADIGQIQKNMGSTYLSEEELIDIAKTLRTSRLVKKFLSENLPVDAIIRIASQSLVVDKSLEEKIFSTFDENLNIRQDATPELKGLYAALRDNEKNLKNTVSSLLNSADFSKHLQENIYTTRDDRIVFQVMASSKSKVPGIVHDVSATNKTFYIEPEQIVPLNNKIREIKANIHSEIVRILAGLTSLVKDEIKELVLSEQILATIDYHFAKARYAVKIQAVEPEIVTHKFVEIENMKHPLLIGNVGNVVTNNFEIGKDYKSVIITGSNTGGKTVTIKTIGLFILMAKAGMFLPCTAAKIYPFENVFADIGDDQSILQNLSTFSSHMTNIIEIINRSNEKSFVLLDEICAGTDPVEGAVLAQVILEKLAQKNVLSTVTTHYGELKALEYLNPYFKNASVEFNTETLRPTYKLLIGIPGLSNAISIAANLGLEQALVDKAKNIVVSTKDPSILVVEKLQETQAKLAQNLEEAENLKETSQNLKTEYEHSLAEVKKDKKKTVKIIKDKFDREMLDAKAEIKEILDELRREKSEKIARRSYARLAQTEQKFRGKLSEFDEKQQYKEINWSNVKTGDKLILKELHQPVTILALPDKNNYIMVQMGNFKTKIKCDKLAPYDAAFEKKENVYRPSSFEKFELRKTSISNTLDLRGYKVEDALDSLEFYLDKASLANLANVTVIHGHGTGALKSAVRDFLSTSPYVAKFRPGEDNEGGDGVSIVDIN